MKRKGNAAVVLIVAGVALVFLMILGAGSCKTVDPGHVGIRISMGRVDPQIVPAGFTLKMPLITSIQEVNVQQQTMSGEATCFSQDLQAVKVKYAIMYRVPDASVVKLYTDYKGDVFDSLVNPRLQEALKQVTSGHNAEQLVQKRDQIRIDALTKIKALIGDLVLIQDLSIVNVDLSDQLQHAIEQKMVKQQESLAKKYELEKEKQQAEITVVQATAEANAIKVKAAAIAQSPNIIDLEIVKKWDGKSPTTIVVGEGGRSAKTILPIGPEKK